MTTLLPGLALDTVAVSTNDIDAPISEPHLILAANQKLDMLIAIPVTARHKQGRHYFLGSKSLSYSEINGLLDPKAPSLAVRPFVARSEANLTDQELDKKYRRKGQTESVALRQLKLRWSMIDPLVSSTDAELLFDPIHRSVLLQARAREIMADHSLWAKVSGKERQAKVKRDRKQDGSTEAAKERLIGELQRLLNQFWAGGSVRGALIGFGGNSGGRGKAKKAGTAKRGRKNSKQVSDSRLEGGAASDDGINVEEGSEHAKIIKFCHDTWVVRGTTVATALRRMWTEFYSELVQQPDGTTKKEWVDWQRRPTRSHFTYWGTKEDKAAMAWRKQLPPTKFDKSYRAVMGSVTDDVYGIGQRGGIDSTPPDIELIRAIDRLARVGGGHRIIVVDAMFGYIPGLYMGFDAASSKTVRLALFNACNAEKKQWLEDLSLDDEIPHEDFIPMWFSNLWADNTDLRTEDIKTCATGINTNIHFVPKLRSDLNALPESGHHILHRLVDHKLAGTTYGRPSQRGEVKATYRARHTMFEAIRETVRAIHVHNTAELEDNRPLRMRLKNVPTTRLHMTQELIRIGKVARALHAVDFARRQLLPRHPGTFTLKGVRLHRRDDTDKPEYVNHIAYVSNHPIIVRRCDEARKGGKRDEHFFRAEFIVNPYQPRRIWYLDLATGEPIELTLKVLKVRDDDLPYVMTLPDMIDRDRVEGGERLDLQDARERRVGAMEVSQRESNDVAEEKYQAAVQDAGGEPSKKAMRANKKANRDEEAQSTLLGMPISAKVVGDRPGHTPPSEVHPASLEVAQDTDQVPTDRTSEGTASKALAPAQPRAKNSLLRAATARLTKTEAEQ